MTSASNFSRLFISSIVAMPLMLRSGALRSCETARRKSSFSAISELRRLLAVSSCAVRWRILFSRSRLASARSWRCCLTCCTIWLKERASVPIRSGRSIATAASRSPWAIRWVAPTSLRIGTGVSDEPAGRAGETDADDVVVLDERFADALDLALVATLQRRDAGHRQGLGEADGAFGGGAPHGCAGLAQEQPIASAQRDQQQEH